MLYLTQAIFLVADGEYLLIPGILQPVDLGAADAVYWVMIHDHLDGPDIIGIYPEGNLVLPLREYVWVKIAEL